MAAGALLGGGPRRPEPRDRGQGTVEAAFLIPVLFVGLLLLLQPGILLYDRIVMGAAASEACRLLVTSTDAAGDMTESCESFVRHRLSAVPQVDCFHVHGGGAGCSWEIELSGTEDSESVSVTIRNQAEPLPLIGAASTLLGIVNEEGNYVIEVSCEQDSQPSWLLSSELGLDPSEWAGAWAS